MIFDEWFFFVICFVKPDNSTYFGGLKKIQIKHYFDRNGNNHSHNVVRYFFCFKPIVPRNKNCICSSRCIGKPQSVGEGSRKSLHSANGLHRAFLPTAAPATHTVDPLRLMCRGRDERNRLRFARRRSAIFFFAAWVPLKLGQLYGKPLREKL